jgi:hypothetical protein
MNLSQELPVEHEELISGKRRASGGAQKSPLAKLHSRDIAVTAAILRTKAFQLGAFGNEWPERLTIVTKWRPLDSGGIDDLKEWRESVKEPVLIARSVSLLAS